MRRTQVCLVWISAVLLVLATTTATRAEEVEKRLRLAFGISGYSSNDQVHSASGNRRSVFEPDGELFQIISDPRNDSGALSNFGVEPAYGGTFSASYSFDRMWYLEGSVGYRQGTVGNVEVQAQFQGVPIPVTQNFLFTVFNFDGGKLTQIPLQATAGIRFRPKAAFNPFICLGVGYTFNSFEPSDEMNQLSLNLDQTTAAFARLSGGAFQPSAALVNLSGVTVDAPDAPEWHAGGGFEYSFHSKWVVFLDARYTVYSGKFAMRVNGGSELGISVPADRVYTTEPGAFGPFGSYSISQGGLVDGGSWVPTTGAPVGTVCSPTQTTDCTFTGPPDGVLDPGYYYVRAGEVRYDGFSVQLGVKFTF